MPPTLFSRPGRPGHGEIKDLLVPAFSRHLVMLLLVNSTGLFNRVGGMPRSAFTSRPRSGRVTSTHTNTENSPVAINTELNRFEFLLISTRRKHDSSITYVLELQSTPDLLKSISDLTITRNASLLISIRSELQLKRRSSVIKKGTLWTEFSIIVRTLIRIRVGS